MNDAKILEVCPNLTVERDRDLCEEQGSAGRRGPLPGITQEISPPDFACSRPDRGLFRSSKLYSQLQLRDDITIFRYRPLLNNRVMPAIRVDQQAGFGGGCRVRGLRVIFYLRGKFFRPIALLISEQVGQGLMNNVTSAFTTVQNSTENFLTIAGSGVFAIFTV